jgi:hypothetical protein
MWSTVLRLVDERIGLSGTSSPVAPLGMQKAGGVFSAGLLLSGQGTAAGLVDSDVPHGLVTRNLLRIGPVLRGSNHAATVST